MSESGPGALHSPNQTVAHRVRRLRARRGWSQHQFAQMLGERMRRSVDSVTVSNMERPDASGRRWTVDELAAAAEVLGVSTGYLLGESAPERLRSLADELERGVRDERGA
jgi:transcriptional regulator with XRE-family HTH domain